MAKFKCGYFSGCFNQPDPWFTLQFIPKGPDPYCLHPSYSLSTIIREMGSYFLNIWKIHSNIKVAMTKPASNLPPLIWAFPHLLMGKNAAVMLCLELRRLSSHVRPCCEHLTIWVPGQCCGGLDPEAGERAQGFLNPCTYHPSRGLALVPSTHTGHLSQSQKFQFQGL